MLPHPLRCMCTHSAACAHTLLHNKHTLRCTCTRAAACAHADPCASAPLPCAHLPLYVFGTSAQAPCIAPEHRRTALPPGAAVSQWVHQCEGGSSGVYTQPDCKRLTPCTGHMQRRPYVPAHSCATVRKVTPLTRKCACSRSLRSCVWWICALLSPLTRFHAVHSLYSCVWWICACLSRQAHSARLFLLPTHQYACGSDRIVCVQCKAVVNTLSAVATYPELADLVIR
jgi:hypothetical protein